MRSKFIVFTFLVVFGFSEEPWGKDSDIKYIVASKKKKKYTSILTKIADKVISFHQTGLKLT